MLPIRRSATIMLASVPLLFLLGTAVLVGCGSSGGSSSEVSEQGDVVVGITDAEGDFLSYIVDVKSLKLVHASGAVVETLPSSTRVDFAQQTEMTEFLTAATVPSGRYTSASIVLDYTSAQIVVEDAGGNAKDAVAQDEQGGAVGELSLDVTFSDNDPLVVVPGLPSQITLDFDLEATNSVDTAPDPAVVTVEPVLIADTVLGDPKPHRLRGLLDSVDLDASKFWVRLRPFQRRGGRFGTLPVAALDTTVYEIDGQSYGGRPGLEALAAMPQDTATVVYGQLDVAARRFEAQEVYAGTSVPWGDDDLATGNVVARSGDLLTMRGVTLVRSDGSIVFHDDVTVSVGDQTTVTEQGSYGEAFDKNDISVGQRVAVVGTLTDSVPPGLALDATQGHVRLLYTNLSATVVTVLPLVVDLQLIDGRRVSLFDFTGTGAGEDADPDNYEVDTSGLSLDELAAGDPVKVRGFVERFGTAPPDFVARTVVGVSELPARMAITWRRGGPTDPFASMSDSELVVDLQAGTLGQLHHVFRLAVATDLLDLGADPKIVPFARDGRGIYTIAQSRTVQVFTDFTQFENALEARLDGSTTLDRIYARGHFSDSVPGMSARVSVVRLH